MCTIPSSTFFFVSNEFLFPVAKVIVTWFVKNVTNFDCKNDTVFRPVSKW
ncbi:hypothetical protein FM120_02285 [Sphingobacterium faecium PCAi_F2.5]|nr:hypothetical protein FM120_02285 [Sphingobacterium faecium PCAi_F2.5]